MAFCGLAVDHDIFMDVMIYEYGERALEDPQTPLSIRLSNLLYLMLLIVNVIITSNWDKFLRKISYRGQISIFIILR